MALAPSAVAGAICDLMARAIAGGIGGSVLGRERGPRESDVAMLSTYPAHRQEVWKFFSFRVPSQVRYYTVHT